MATKVLFDPIGRIIDLKSGITNIDFVKDVYSEGKIDWLTDDNLNKYRFPIRVVGGDDLGGGQKAPVFFFLQYGWKIRTPGEGLDIAIGLNVYSQDGTPPVIVQTPDNVTLRVSDIPQIISGSGLSASQANMLLEIWKLIRGDEKEDRTAGTIKRYEEGTNNLLLDKIISENQDGSIELTKA